jgi:hypothetical protein
MRPRDDHYFPISDGANVPVRACVCEPAAAVINITDDGANAEYNTPPLNGDPHSLARSELTRIAKDLTDTPLAIMEETLRHCVPFVEEMVEAGLAERCDATDAIWQACVNAGFVAQKGADAVQDIIADCIKHKRENGALAARDSRSILQRSREQADGWATINVDVSSTRPLNGPSQTLRLASAQVG